MSPSHHTKYTTIFFDWGGVIAGNPDDNFLKSLLVSLGATDQQIQEINQTYMKQFVRGQISELDYWHSLRQRFNLSLPDSISSEFKRWNGLKANQEILVFVDGLRAHGFKVALLSNVIEPTYNVLAEAGYYDRVDVVVASCKVGFAKPEPEIYQLALQQTGATPQESIFIDDQQRALDPAAAMGFTTILAQHPQQIIRDLRHVLQIDA